MKAKWTWGQKLAITAAGVVAAGLLVLLVGGGIAYYLWKSPPAYWVDYEKWLVATTPQERQAIAQALEERIKLALLAAKKRALARNGTDAVPPGLSKVEGPGLSKVEGLRAGSAPANNASAELTPVDPADLEVEITLTPTEANAWLHESLAETLEHQHLHLPEGIKGMMIALQNDKLQLAFRYETPRLAQVFTVETKPTVVTVEGKPKVQFALQGVRGGRLPLPTGALASAAGDDEQGKLQKSVESVLATLQGQPIDGLLPYPNDRSQMLRITALSLRNNQMQLKLRPEKAHH